MTLDRRRPPIDTRPLRLALAVKAAAAAVCLLAVTVLLVVLIMRPGDSGRAETRIDSIVVLADSSVPLRGLPARKTVIEAGHTNRLLLELTNLGRHPGPDELFVVRIMPDQAQEPAWATEVRGREFARDYAMLLTLPASSMTPGVYTVEVLDENEVRVFGAGIEVRY